MLKGEGESPGDPETNRAEDKLPLTRPASPGHKVILPAKMQRHYFANKDPSSRGYGFSSGHVWTGSGRSPGEGNDNPFQYSCLENPLDREA